MGFREQFLGGEATPPPDEILRLLFSPSMGEGLASGISLHAYKAALDQIANIVCTDLNGDIVYANGNFCKLNKCSILDILGKNNRIFNSGYHPPQFFKNLWETIRAGKIWHGEIRNRAMDGSLYWVDTKIAPRYDDAGRPIGYVALRLDVTARKQAETLATEENRKRRETEALLNDIVDTLPNGIVAYDKDGCVSFFNKAHKQIYEDIVPGIEIGRRREDGVTPDNFEAVMPKQHGETRASTTCCEPFIQHLPSDRWIKVQNRRSSTGTLVSVQTDVTDLKHAEQQIAYQAERDSLTGIFNRHAFVARLSSAIGRAKAKERSFELVLVDLDDYKAINDGLGHDAGDALLRHVADSLQSALRRSDTVARIGGDEFAILICGNHAKTDIKHIMERLRTAVATPARIGQKTIVPSASMGVATFPRDGQDPDNLMKSADLALHQCKREARGGYKQYNSSMRRQRVRRSKLTEKLKLALARDEFSVVLQPQCDMADGRHTSFEALVRWKVGGKWVPPEDLISVAEDAGLISQLSHQIMDKALAMMARIKRSGLEPGILGINVVAPQLHEPSFVKTLMHLLATHGVAPSEIEIEVTENVILDRSAGSIARVLKKLHVHGMSIALDDFGMGYASLTHLKRFPLDRLKIDRSFIAGMLEDQDDHVIVRTVISLAHNLGLRVVAEGVETSEQYEELLKLGCDAAQGFLIGKPMDESLAADHCKQSTHQRPVAVAALRDKQAQARANKPPAAEAVGQSHSPRNSRSKTAGRGQ